MLGIEEAVPRLEEAHAELASALAHTTVHMPLEDCVPLDDANVAGLKEAMRDAARVLTELNMVPS